MTKFGSNMKMTAARELQSQLRALFEGVFGCERVTPNDTIDLFGFADGANIGVDYVDADKALTVEQQKSCGTWIELEVEDEEATAGALEACEGVTAFSFVTPHRYFQLPGGQVVRLKRE